MQQRVDHAASELKERVPPVLSNRGFRLLWLAQIISQTAQNAILYALIIVVLDLTESTTSTSVVVLSFVVPTVAFGLFSGILVDRWSKRRLLIITNGGRAVAALAYLFAREHVWAIVKAPLKSVLAAMSCRRETMKGMEAALLVVKS